MHTLKNLYDAREKFQSELEELHMYEPSPEVYKERRYYLEGQIAMIEDAIVELEYLENAKKRYAYLIVGAIALALLLILIV